MIEGVPARCAKCEWLTVGRDLREAAELLTRHHVEKHGLVEEPRPAPSARAGELQELGDDPSSGGS